MAFVQTLDFLLRTSTAQHSMAFANEFIRHRATETTRDAGYQDDFSAGHDSIL
jgi:hypothetical protein